MRKFAPSLLVVILSDVEVAHFGSYSLYVAGIRTGDRLTHQLWQEVQTNSEYSGRTTMLVLPEFGRDPDGSPTHNGFFNHRAYEDSTRTTWMMCLGTAVDRPQIVERTVSHIDVCPTLAALLGCTPSDARGARLEEFRT
jgi:arylsulfatase A-like enzyme